MLTVSTVPQNGCQIRLVRNNNEVFLYFSQCGLALRDDDVDDDDDDDNLLSVSDS